jgi:hypothetical protein
MIRAVLRGVKEWTNTIESPAIKHSGGAKQAAMAMRITYPDGSTEIIPEATRVDQQNFHEGMYDFYDERGNLLRQIDMHSKIKWEIADDSEE